ncbi:MAG: CHAT domain-containing protein, partial [Dehalococcoidia bacterium]
REEIARTLPENLFVEEQSMAAEIDELEREVYALTYAYDRNDRLLERKEGDLEAKRELYTILMRTIQERYPQYAITKRRDLGNVRSLPVRSGEAVLIYHVLPRGVFVWAITPGQSGAAIRSFARINTDIRLPLWKALQGFYLREDPDSISQESLDLLSDQLLKPVLSTLTTASRLTIVRDGALAQLPFEMLPSPDDSKQMVLDRWMVGYYPSLLSMMVIRTSAQSEKEFGEKVLLVGDAQYKLTPDTNQPDNVKGAKRVKLRSGKSLDELPYSAVEIRRIGELFRSRDLQTTILRRSAASEGRIKQLKLEEYKYLHFAVHGLLAYEVIDVGEPSLALSVGGNGDNGFLTASEVMGLRLNAELAVLSACDTALGEYHPGEGYANLARAFMSAGAESVIVSQWAVEDQSTAELMVELYRNLAKGLSAPEALKAAKITLRKQYPSPYYWAPFVLMGG